jgi:hypothetical protein
MQPTILRTIGWQVSRPRSTSPCKGISSFNWLTKTKMQSPAVYRRARIALEVGDDKRVYCLDVK